MSIWIQGITSIAAAAKWLASNVSFGTETLSRRVGGRLTGGAAVVRVPRFHSGSDSLPPGRDQPTKGGRFPFASYQEPYLKWRRSEYQLFLLHCFFCGRIAASVRALKSPLKEPGA